MLLSNTGWLLLSTAATSLLGVVYWWVSARHFLPGAIGVGSAAISAMMLVGTLATLGLGTLAMGELQRSPMRARELIAGTITAAFTAGVAGGLIASVVLPLVASDLSVLSSSLPALILYSVGTGATAAAMVADQVSVGLLRSGIQFWRNVVMSIAKLATVVAAALIASSSTSVPIFAAWGLGVSASLVYALLKLIAVVPDTSFRLRDGLRMVFTLRAQAAGHYFFNIALQLPALVLPVVCLAVLSSAANARFYISWMIAVLLFMVPIALTNVLYPMNVGEPGQLRRSSTFTLGLSLGIGVLGTIVLFLVGGEVLRVFGEAYISAHFALVALAAGAIPMSIKSHYVAVSRIRGVLARRLPVAWFGATLEISIAAAAGAEWGTVNAFAVGWLLATTAEATVMFPSLLGDLGGVRRGSPP